MMTDRERYVEVKVVVVVLEDSMVDGGRVDVIQRKMLKYRYPDVVCRFGDRCSLRASTPSFKPSCTFFSRSKVCVQLRDRRGGLRRQGPMHNSESDPELRVRGRGGEEIVS
jgi:hypothetical protein